MKEVQQGKVKLVTVNATISLKKDNGGKKNLSEFGMNTTPSATL